MMKFVEEYARKDGIFVIELSLQIHREEAHKFYKKLGYNIFRQSFYFEKNLQKIKKVILKYE